MRKTVFSCLIALLCTPIASSAARCPTGTFIGQIAISPPAGSKLPGVTARLIQGTDLSQLKHGPGHYPSTAMPGQGETVAFAGHRTSWGAWFRNLDRFPKGTLIHLKMTWPRPKSFCYRMTGQKVIAYNDMSVIRKRGHEVLVLTACHPPYDDYQRIVAFAWPAEC